jgi:Zn-dependent protease/CBS domain-containing protein
MASGGLSGWAIARIFGITIRIHASWVLIFLLLAYSLAEELLPQSSLVGGGPWWRGMDAYNHILAYQKSEELISFYGAAEELGIAVWPWWQYWLLGIIGSIGLFVCVLAHEIAHSIVAKRAGIPVEGITLFVFGGVSQLKKETETPGDEFRVAAAGPAMSVALGLACGALYLGLYGALPAQARAILFYFAFINLALAAFNLLPGFPLDGGRLLRAVLWNRYQDMARATVAASRWGEAIGTGFAAFGLFLICWAAVHQQLWLGPLWLVVIGLFLRHAAAASYRQLAVRDAFAGLTVRDVIRPDVVPVEPDLTLDRLVDEFFYAYKFRSFPVLEGGRLAGVISLKDVQAVPRAQWPARRVRDTMHLVREENLVRPGDDLSDVFRKMAEEDKGHLPVVEDGRLVGIVTRHDIMTLIQLKTDLGGHCRPASR